MKAFYRNGETLIKVYDHDSDWQALCQHGKQAAEFWSSTWAADRRGSLVNAFGNACSRLGVAFDPSCVVEVAAA
jgi:hypothetical protein